MSSWRDFTNLELEPRFTPGQHVCVLRDVLDLAPRGARHQPRVRAGTRVRIITITGVPDDPKPIYRVEILEERGRDSGYWAVVSEDNLTEAPALSFLDRLRLLGR